LYEVFQFADRVGGIDGRDRGIGFGFEIVADRFRIAAAPLGQIGVAVFRANGHCALVDRDHEPLRQFPFGGFPSGFDGNLRRDIAPVNDDFLCHDYSE